MMSLSASLGRRRAAMNRVRRTACLTITAAWKTLLFSHRSALPAYLRAIGMGILAVRWHCVGTKPCFPLCCRIHLLISKAFRRAKGFFLLRCWQGAVVCRRRRNLPGGST